MPWDMNDYPASMKGLDPLVRKKAIDIANALEEEGYDENRLIPIAQSQAEEWYDQASEKEKKDFKNAKDPKKSDKHDASGNPDLVDNDVQVLYQEDVWKVWTKGAKRPERTFDHKEDAVKEAEKKAKNKGSTVYIYKQNGDLQDKKKPNGN